MSNDETALEEMPKPIFSGKTYDFVKKLVQVIFPALGTLYFTLANLWGLPAAEQVVGSLTAFTLFLGVLVGISSNRYNAGMSTYAGELLVTTQNGEVAIKKLSLDLTPAQIAGRKTIVFNVTPTLEE